MGTKTEKDEKQGLGSTQKILIAGFAILIVVIAVAGFFIYQKLNTNQTANTGGNLVIDENNLGDVESQLSESVKDGMFEVNMSTAWIFPDGSSPASDAFLANGSANKYPITFDIIINDDIVFTSDLIPVGKQIKEIKLEQALAAGTYDAVCMYHLWKEDGTENSSFGVNIKLRIEN